MLQNKQADFSNIDLLILQHPLTTSSKCHILIFMSLSPADTDIFYLC